MLETNQQQAESGISLLDLPIAKLQIIQASDTIKENWLDRSQLEPKLTQNVDGLWMISIHCQGQYKTFDVPFIDSKIILANAELGLVVVLVAYHGNSTEKYGRLGYLTQKGQFYRYYQQQASGSWLQTPWRTLNDDLRHLIISTVKEQGPEWAKSPGKLRAEHKPPSKPATMTSYKVVRFVDGRYWSLYDPTVEYVLGERLKERAKPKHSGGFYSYPTHEMGTKFLDDCVECIPFHRDIVTPQLALLECEIGGRIIDYGHKMASTYLRPLQVLKILNLKDDA